jgi:hypothetical protein
MIEQAQDLGLRLERYAISASEKNVLREAGVRYFQQKERSDGRRRILAETSDAMISGVFV